MNKDLHVQEKEEGLPEDYFYIFPNPTENWVRIKSSKEIQAISIQDGKGEIVMLRTTSFSEMISLASFASGTYTVKVQFKDETSCEKSIVRQ